MNQDHFILANSILKDIASNPTIWSRDTINDKYVGRNGYSLEDIHFTMERLEADNFIRYYLQSKILFLITRKGEKAAKIGLKKYYDREDKLETEALRIRVISYYLMIITSIISIATFLLTYFK